MPRQEKDETRPGDGHGKICYRIYFQLYVNLADTVFCCYFDSSPTLAKKSQFKDEIEDFFH